MEKRNTEESLREARSLLLAKQVEALSSRNKKERTDPS